MKLLTKRILAAFKKQGDTSQKNSEDVLTILKPQEICRNFK